MNEAKRRRNDVERLGWYHAEPFDFDSSDCHLDCPVRGTSLYEKLLVLEPETSA
jgi:hypothetical protein